MNLHIENILINCCDISANMNKNNPTVKLDYKNGEKLVIGCNNLQELTKLIVEIANYLKHEQRSTNVYLYTDLE